MIDSVASPATSPAPSPAALNSNYGLCLVLHALSLGADSETNGRLVREYCARFDALAHNDACFTSSVEVVHSLGVELMAKFVEDASRTLNTTVATKRLDRDGQKFVSIKSKIDFKCTWRHPFTDVGAMPFDGGRVTVPMMLLVDSLHFGSVYAGTGFVVPFDVPQYSLILFLPYTKYTTVDQAHLDPVEFYTNCTRDHPAEAVRITMPKFNATADNDYTRILQINIPSLFNSSIESYTRLAKGGQLELRQVSQHVELEVNERGARASVETEAELGFRLGEPTYVFDRPFVGHLINTEKKQTLLSFEYTHSDGALRSTGEDRVSR